MRWLSVPPLTSSYPLDINLHVIGMCHKNLLKAAGLHSHRHALDDMYVKSMLVKSHLSAIAQQLLQAAAAAAAAQVCMLA